MTIKINDKTYELPEASTVADALEHAGINTRGIATAVNNCVEIGRASCRERV